MASQSDTPFLRAVTSPLNLAILGGSAMITYATESAAIMAVGVVAFGALVAWDVVATPSRAMLPAPPVYPDAATLLDNSNVELIISMQSARSELEKVLSETPRSVCNQVLGALVKIRQLESHAIALILRNEDIEKYLRTKNITRIRDENQRLERAARGARDATAREEYQRAVKARTEQLKALEELEDARERIRANLARILATLEGLSPKVVRMRALDAQSLDAAGGDVSRELEMMDREIQDFEDTLRIVAEGGVDPKEAALDAELAGQARPDVRASLPPQTAHPGAPRQTQ